MEAQIDPKRLEWLENLQLGRGAHSSRKDGACALEAASWLAGEKFSDHPICVSRVLGAFVRRFNDLLDDEGRQKIKPFIPRLLNTAASEEVEQARGWLAADWSVRHAAPAWLELAGLKEQAEALRSLPEITRASYESAKAPIRAAREASWSFRAKAREKLKENAAAYADAAYAAYAAAAYAAYAADAYAADAAYAAAYAADAAVKKSIYATVYKAVLEKLKPTSAGLQQSGFELLERMLAVS